MAGEREGVKNRIYLSTRLDWGRGRRAPDLHAFSPSRARSSLMPSICRFFFEEGRKIGKKRNRGIKKLKDGVGVGGGDVLLRLGSIDRQAGLGSGS